MTLSTNGLTNVAKESSEPTPKVLIAEKVSQDGIALLRQNLDVHEKKGLSPEELESIIPDYDALIVRSETKVTASLLKKGSRLRVVARAGVGVDNVDVDAATKQGVIVVNSPSGNIRAAAEHTIALMLAVARNIPDGCASIKAGKWERSRLVGIEVKGRTLGIIGLGKVGLLVARMANGLGMNVCAVDPYASPEIAADHNVTLHLSLSAMLPVVDFLTIHTPLIASTKGMISAGELKMMKPGARILNVARGGVIDEQALLEALESGHIAGAGIDVFTTEPPAESGSAAKLISHPRVVATPHLGASTVEAQENVSLDVCTQVISILSGELPRSAVNAPIILPEEYKKLQPFVRLVEKMGALYTQHYTGPARQGSSKGHQQAFDLVYEGEITNMTNTKPLFAALVKGLLQGISSDTNVNIVNATLLAKERGLIINEQHSRDPITHTYSSLVTLRARPSRSASQERRRPMLHSTPSSSGATTATAATTTITTTKMQEQIIQGFCSDTQIFISRLDRFNTSFVPEGRLVVCHNFDSPGMIGCVGSILGKEGININFMSVAPVRSDLMGVKNDGDGDGQQQVDGEREHEALMILGVDKEVGPDVAKTLEAEKGIIDVSVMVL
ncbi:MAG: hypothetical protein M1816_004526 [Peltula sp. TS41687]|nr:MAG: hypothetical protein M1816_004526 [Peltula sp. TS41687]